MTLIRLYLFALVFTTSLPVSSVAGNLTRGPYLQKSTSDSVVVVWRTAGKSEPMLRYGSSPDSLSNEVSGGAITLRVSADVADAPGVARLYKEPVDEVANREADHDPSTAPNTYQYEASLSGLKTNTRYYYAIYDDSRLLAGEDEDHYFVTHPKIGSSAKMRLWVVGDSGTGGVDQVKVHQSMIAFVNRTNRRVDHYLHVGDMAYSDGTDREFQENFFLPYQATLRNTVCWPAMGNHEGHTSRGISGFGPYYDAYVLPTNGEVGGVPSGTEAYYSFDIGDTHFVCLDSHDLDRSPDAAMAQWLRADLEQVQAKWLIAFWHHPPYTLGSHNSNRERQLIEMRETFMPILEAGGVDLTLTGHSHIYERSMLMDGAYETPTTAEGVILDDGDGRIGGDGAYRKSEGIHPHEGSISIVAGHGGAGLSREGTMPVMREIILEHGSVLIDIDGDTMTTTMLNKNGRIRDVFSIVKKGTVTPTRIQNPWQPHHDVSLLTELRLNFREDKPGSMPEDWSLVSGDKSANHFKVVAAGSGEPKRLQVRADREPLIALYSPWSLHEYEFGASMKFGRKNGSVAGLVLGYQNARNFALVMVDASAETIRFSRFSNGVETLINEQDAKTFKDKWLNIEVEVEGNRVEIQFQDDEGLEPEIEFSFHLESIMGEGPVGIFVPEKNAVEFKEFTIEDNAWFK